jgi:hypothetical protein
MSLEKRIQTSLDQDLQALTKKLEGDLVSQKRELEKQLSKLERSYKTDVESEIQHRVNARLHQESQANRFEKNFDFQDQLNALFTENIEEILATKQVSKLVDAYFKALKSADKVVIGGAHQELLTKLAKKHSLQVVVENSSKLGYVLGIYPDQTLEFSLEDLIETLQKKTLPTILA